MQKPLLLVNEKERPTTSYQNAGLEVERDERCDRITRMAANLLACPIALISLRDENRFRSMLGSVMVAVHHCASFCAHALQNSDVYEIPDARLDERFSGNPAVNEEPHIVFFAAAPIATPAGQIVGALCVIDHQPRQLTLAQRGILQDLARCAQDCIHLDKVIRDSHQLLKTRRLSATISRAQKLFMGSMDHDDAFDELLREVQTISESGIIFIGAIRSDLQVPAVVKTYLRSDIRSSAAFAHGAESACLQHLVQSFASDPTVLILNNAAAIATWFGPDVVPPAQNSLLVLPVYWGKNLLAMVGVGDRKGGYDREMVEFFQPLLGAVAQLVETLRIRKIHQAHERELKRLTLVASQTDSGLIITEIDGAIDWVNDGFSRMNGYHLEQLRGKPFWEIFSGQEGSAIATEQMSRALLECASFNVELKCSKHDGSTYWARIVGNPLYGDAKVFQGFIAIVTDISAEHRKTELLAERERHLRMVIDGTRSGTWEWNISTDVLVLNDRWATIIGYDLKDIEPVSSQRWKALIHPDDRQHVTLLLQKHIRGDTQFYDCKYRMLHKSGHWVWVHDRGQVFSRDENGKPRLMSGTHFDITDVMVVRRALEVKQQQLNHMLANLPGMVYRYENYHNHKSNETRSMYFVSPGIEHVTGYSANEFLPGKGGKKSYEDLIHPDDVERVKYTRAQAVNTGYQLEYRVRHLDGEYRWVEEIGRGSTEPDGESDTLYFLDGFVWDITERKSIRTSLEAERNKLASLYQMAPIGIASSDFARSCFVDANPELLNLLDYSLPELLQLDWRSLILPNFHADIERHSTELARTGRFGPYEVQMVAKHGKVIDVGVSGARVRESNGEDRVWTIVQDISQQKQLEKMKSELIAVVSHELRTPLTSIIGSLGLVRSQLEKNSSAGRLSDLMEIAYNNGHRLNMLVNDLLDMEKLMAGKIAFKMEVIPLEDLLYQAIAENQAYADTYHVRLSLQTGCMGARIAVDRLRFQQIMSNLLSNAAKFSYQGQEITISVSILGDSARIAVADRGCGIPPDFHARVFQKFSQVDSSSSRKKEGSGLGLAITRELVERMDGAIQFHSVVGEGTTFFITFPLAAAP